MSGTNGKRLATPSAALLVWARELDIGWHEKSLLFILISYDGDGVSDPSQVELAAAMGCSARYVRVLTKRLEDQGVIYVERYRSEHGTRLGNIYNLQHPALG
jgi:DNA-binding MarR family transcriptional regulator